ncbi:unnamed protein product, partial [Phaeothamnion confervicola]
MPSGIVSSERHTANGSVVSLLERRPLETHSSHSVTLPPLPSFLFHCSCFTFLPLSPLFFNRFLLPFPFLPTFFLLSPSLAPSLRKKALMRGYARRGMSNRAFELLKRAKYRGVAVDVSMHNLCITACGMAGKWRNACDVIPAMRRAGIAPNAASYAAAIAACAAAMRSKPGKRLPNESPGGDGGSDVGGGRGAASFSRNVIRRGSNDGASAAARSDGDGSNDSDADNDDEDAESATAAEEGLVAAGVNDDGSTGSAGRIDSPATAAATGGEAFSTASDGSPKTAAAPKQGSRVIAEFINAARRAVALLAEMRAAGVPVDGGTFTSLMQVHGAAGDTVGAAATLADMAAAGIHPTPRARDALVEAHARAGDLPGAWAAIGA